MWGERTFGSGCCGVAAVARDTLLALCLVALLHNAAVADPPQPQKTRSPNKEKATPAGAPDASIQKLIQQLGSRDFAERDAAMKRLERIGKPALRALRDAAKNDGDPEIQRRAQRLVERLSPEPDPLEELFKEASRLQEKRDYQKAAELFDKVIEKGKARYHPGPVATTGDVPFLTLAYLHYARVRKQLGEYEKAADAYGRASYYSNSNTERRQEIRREWLAMIAELLAHWDRVVKKKVNGNASVKPLAEKYPLVLLHTRRFAGGRYFHSTYSFLYETSDQDKHYNDVQLQFDNGKGENTFNLNCAVGQENRVADLGKVEFTKDPDPAKVGAYGKTSWSSKECKAVEDHVYLEEIKDDRGNHFFVVFQVVATDPESRFVAFLWRKLPGGTVVKRP